MPIECFVDLLIGRGGGLASCFDLGSRVCWSHPRFGPCQLELKKQGETPSGLPHSLNFRAFRTSSFCKWTDPETDSNRADG